MHASAPQPLVEIRPSPIHGTGIFATAFIAKGTRIIEYTGERISREEADARYDDEAMEYPHTFLFIVDKKTVIDGARQGNEARFINHSCEPNCQAVVDDGRVFVEAVRDIALGMEITYDYHLTRGRYRAEWKARYPCHCGAPSCRGTLLHIPQRRSPKRRARRAKVRLRSPHTRTIRKAWRRDSKR